MAARTIDPATGASTWALGSQRWTVYMGIFTKKATIINSHQIVIIKFEEDGAINGMGIKVDLFHVVNSRIINKRGREAEIV